MQLQALDSLTPEAFATLYKVPPDQMMTLVQMAQDLTLPEQHGEAARQEKEDAFQKLLRSMHGAFQALSQENESLQAALSASQRRERETAATLRARLLESEAQTESKHLATQARERQHQDETSALRLQIEVIQTGANETKKEHKTLKERVIPSLKQKIKDAVSLLDVDFISWQCDNGELGSKVASLRAEVKLM